MPEGDKEKQNIEQSEIDFVNAKRTYDTYQDLDLQTARRVQQYADEVHATVMRIINNAVTADHMETMRAMGHEELAVDRQWNPDEVAELVTKTPVFLDAIAAAVAAAVNEALAKK